MKKRFFILICIFFILLLLCLLIIRAILPKQIDDVNPYINCEEELLKKSDIFYIIPIYKGIPINETKEWCNYILSFNKTLQIHGIYHNYNEFGSDISKENMELAISIFEDCFGKKPTNFKAPQLKINKNNKNMIKEIGLELDGKINQIFHKVYHCNDTGYLSNKFNDLF